MNKLEKYFEELKNIRANVAIVNDEPRECVEVECSECRRDNIGSCSHKILIEWLAEEYVEKPELTLNEYKLCQILKKGWLVRDRFNGLTFHVTKPSAANDTEWISSGSAFKISDLMFEDIKFKFIKLGDKEPWSVEELLKLEIEF